MNDYEENNSRDSRSSNQNNYIKSKSYKFPEGRITHVGSYGLNENDLALRGFEENAARLRNRQQAKVRAHRKKRRLQVAFILIISIVAISLGGVYLLAFGNTTETDEEIVPVATSAETVEDVEVSEDTVAASEETTAAESEATTDSEDDFDSSYTRVINRTYPIPKNFISGSGELMSIEGKQLETNACIALKEMVAALRAEGMTIIIQSAYRTDEQQEVLYNNQITRQGGNDIKAATISAIPLTSEHQAGLAVDLSVDGTLTEAFSSTEQGQWLKEHCAEYGFILRYPSDKTSVTGIISEPWHFRYVGSVETAQIIMDSGLCMEEYYEKYLAEDDLDPYLQYLY